MTVKELIDALKQCNENAEVVIDYTTGKYTPKPLEAICTTYDRSTVVLQME